jgi:cytoskeletal protein RodZ
MVNSVGKKLQQSRLAKQLSIEEAARVTRIRPDKLLDLEEDNYSNFPSMSYAKGFLLLYARFLGVDVREFAETLHAPNPVSSDDYEYLNAAASLPPPAPTRRPYHPTTPRRERSAILPVIVFALLAGAIVLGVYLVVQSQRLGSLDDAGDKKDISSPAGSPAISTVPPAAVAAAPAPVLRQASPAVAAASPAAAVSPASLPAPPAPTAAQPMPSPAPAGTFDPTREVRRAEPVFPTPAAHADASAASPAPVGALGAGAEVGAVVPVASPDEVRKISILPVRKTMVTVRKDVADSQPIFKDWLYPGDPPLKLTGHKFWIQIEDPTAVEITRDGTPYPVGQSDIQIE